MVTLRHGGRILAGAPLIAALLVALLPVGRAARSAEPAADDNRRAIGAADEDSAGEVRSPPDPQARTHALSLGFILLACIIMGGALLLALVVTWGNRTRRLAQSPLPPVSERDELWFLKPKKLQPDGERDAPDEPDSNPSERK
jgi:hypothetical protein